MNKKEGDFMTAKESQMFVRALLFAVLSSDNADQMRNAVLAIADKEDVEHVSALINPSRKIIEEQG